MANRFIGDNIRLLYDLISYLRKDDIWFSSLFIL